MPKDWLTYSVVATSFLQMYKHGLASNLSREKSVSSCSRDCSDSVKNIIQLAYYIFSEDLSKPLGESGFFSSS